jgi:NADH-quinone oxidoreductase subunit L
LIFSGPYESLWLVHNYGVAKIAFWVIGLLTVFFTAMYLLRGVTLLFGRIPSAVVQPRFFSPSHLLGISVGAVGLIGTLLLLWSWFVEFLKPALRIDAIGGQPTSLFWLLTLPLLAAFAGWGVACILLTKPKLFSAARSNWAKTMYVLVLNKFYVDEIYSVYIVRPSIRFARWLWRVIDVGGIDRAVVESGQQSVGMARWLWRMIDVRVIDRTVEGTGTRSVGLARWLWEVVDVRRIEKNAERIGHAADATGHKLKDVEPRTLQHHLLVLNLWLVFAIVFFYWFVLS